MKYKCLLVCMFMLASIVASCQEKFIEVTVTDTLTIKANKFVYTIMANSWFDVGDDTTGNMSIEVLQQRCATQVKQQKLMADSFKNVLLHKGFRMLPGNEKSKFTAAAENKPYFINVLTSSLDSVHMISNLIKGNPGFIAFIT